MEQHRLNKYNQLLQNDTQPFVNAYKDNTDIELVNKKYNTVDHDTLQNEKFETNVAGRVTAIRQFGKSSFLAIQDRTDSIQIYIKKGLIPTNQYDTLLPLIDTGDFISVIGFVFKTKTGELTICATSIQILTKALRDLPEKWHGLKDIQTRYRKRYLDLIANPEVKEIFIKRSKIIQLLREFFIHRDFLEVETPMMHTIAGGAAAKPFITHHNALSLDLYLRIAPELYLKRLVIGGLERVFEINRNFRNEGVSHRHNPEFTMIEWYYAYADYYDLMKMIEQYFIQIATAVNGKPVIYIQDQNNNENTIEITLTENWPKITMDEAIRLYSPSTPNVVFTDLNALKSYAKEVLPIFNDQWGQGRILMELFEELVEHKITSPVFIVDYPAEVSPLAKTKKDDPNVAERFELFIGGMEIVNGFNELNNPIIQKQRFLQQLTNRENGDQEAHNMDNDFIVALEHGMPPTAGAGMGIDRFVMLLCAQRNIRDVILFPYMRPENDERSENDENISNESVEVVLNTQE